ncbi:MAG: transcription antitermination factor NusB [Bauldia sp.]
MSPSSETKTVAARPGFATRDAAARLVSAVLDRKKSLDALLDGGDVGFAGLAPRDRALARAIVATALRHHGEIAAVLDRLIDKRPPRASALAPILATAVAQILFMAVADHAAVSIAVDQIAADPAARHYKGLANAVLRRVAREGDALLAGLDPAVLDTPDWLWSRWCRTYGEADARRIAAAHRIEPSLDVTVKSDAHGWAERLGGIVLPTGSVRTAASGMVEMLPGFAEGAWWVQDAAAALPARLLAPTVAGKRVADLCAAPGGKTAALCAAGARVTAVDVSAARLRRLSDNLARLGFAAETVAADIFAWQPDAPFDAVLLDAPCTSTGAIRRHPDIPWLKRPTDVTALADLQARMIERAVALLKPGGVLVYCACSLEPEEGEDQFARALDRLPLAPLPIAAGEIGGLVEVVTAAGTVRTLPFHLPGPSPRLSGLDGFFIMRLLNG